MNYEEILSRALRISWRHKYLWLLALLAGESAAFGLPGTSQGGTPSGRANRGHSFGPAAPTSHDVAAWMTAHAALLWTAGLTLAIVGIGLFLVSAIANGAVIKGAHEHDLDRPFSLGAAWRAGLQTFWRVLGMKVLGVLVTLGVVVAIGSIALVAVAGAAAHNVALAVTAGVPAFLLVLVAIPFWVVFVVAILLGQRAIVLDGKGPLEGLSTGFSLIRRRFGRVALLWLLVGVIGLLLGLAVRIVVVIVAVPLAGIVVAAYFTGGASVAIGFGVVLGLAWLAVALALLAAVSAYTSTVWTLAYTRFEQEPQPLPAASPAPA